MRSFSIATNSALAAMGPRGIAGLGLLIFCAGFYQSWIVPRQEQVRALEAKTARLQEAPSVASGGLGEGGPLTDFYGFFPAAGAIPNTLEKLFALAQRNGLEIAKSEYRLVPSADANITTYQARFPLKGTYVQVRKFVAAALQEFPYASLDELRLEKRRVEEASVDSQIRLTFYLRAQ